MPEPVAGRIYLIALCSGEQRRWRCLGYDARGTMRWCDLESGLEFGEASLMYAWTILGEEAAPTAGRDR